MPDSVTPSSFPLDLQAAYPQADLLWGILETAQTGLGLYSPIRSAEGQIVDFRIDLLNPAAQRMLAQPARPTGTYLGYYPHTLDTGVFAFHRDAFESGELAQMAVNYQADGLDNYFHLTARRVGQGLLVSFTDTANQSRTPVEIALRQAQAELQAAHATTEAQRQQWQAVLQQAPVAIAVLEGPLYYITLANPPVCEIWARTPDQVVGIPLFEALPEIQGQGLEALLAGVMHTGQPYTGTELPIELLRHGRRETVYFNFVYQPQRSPDGTTTGILVVASDVTEMVLARQRVEDQERKTSQLNEELAAANEAIRAYNEELTRSQFELVCLNQELEARVQERTQTALTLQADLLAAAQRQAQQRETFFQVFEQTPACIALLRGPEHRFEYVNAAYQQLFRGRQLVGRPLAEALPETVAQGFVAWLDAVYQTGETFFGTELLLRIEPPDGQHPQDLYFTFTYQAYREQGTVVGISIFAYDVSEQVQARQQVQNLNEELGAINEELQASNAELHEANTQLTRTNADLDNFIYTASHDLKQPIANVEGLLLALQHELPAAGRVGEVPTLLQLMQDAVVRFGRTIGHLTDISRLQKEYLKPTSQISIARLLREVQLDLAPFIEQTGAQIVVDVPEHVSLLFLEKNLRSVLYNLLSNALKYRHPSRVPQVLITYQREGDYHVLGVQDNGLGMNLAQDQERLFAMFQRLHTHVEGSGVGLYMVKKIVENAGGRITVSSEVEQGTTFRVYLPC